MDAPSLRRGEIYVGRSDAVRTVERPIGFREYYQIGGTDESDDTTSEPLKEGELKFEGSHSPFGFVWQIASETGWSVDYILWKVPAQSLLTMIADAPHYRKTKKEDIKAEDDEAKQLGFFQSMFK